MYRSKKTSKLRVTGLCAGNSPVAGEFPAQMTCNAEKFSIWWRHHGNVEDLVNKLVAIDSGNGLSPVCRLPITWVDNEL